MAILNEIQKAAIIDRFNKGVEIYGDQLDPNDEYDWHSIAIGFALGSGASIDDAKEIANKIYYQ